MSRIPSRRLPRTLLFTLPGAIGLAALLSTVLTSSEHYWRSELFQIQVATAQPQLIAGDSADLADSTDLTEMSLARLGQILAREVADLQGGNGQWQATVNGRTVVVLADAANNRMRIVSPVMTTRSLSEAQIQAMLVANFHSALDARYAVSNGTVVSVFVHPLSSLQDNDFRSGLRQVVTLAETFGESYSSGGLGFGANESGPAVPDGSVGI